MIVLSAGCASLASLMRSSAEESVRMRSRKVQPAQPAPLPSGAGDLAETARPNRAGTS